eukprot:g7302.t1
MSTRIGEQESSDLPLRYLQPEQGFVVGYEIPARDLRERDDLETEAPFLGAPPLSPRPFLPAAAVVQRPWVQTQQQLLSGGLPLPPGAVDRTYQQTPEPDERRFAANQLPLYVQSPSLYVNAAGRALDELPRTAAVAVPARGVLPRYEEPALPVQQDHQRDEQTLSRFATARSAS